MSGEWRSQGGARGGGSPDLHGAEAKRRRRKVGDSDYFPGRSKDQLPVDRDSRAHDSLSEAKPLSGTPDGDEQSSISLKGLSC